ncbi:MAG TPA: SGNH/GDSL hydrolase family protein [Aeromonadales bacterium]|nr:SGNH/GDSL hydrolase family protein [Aeromonadales bacterium]
MWNILLAILLFPLLLVEALIVKKQTPRLAEAPGKRKGKCDQLDQPALKLLFLGDSAAAGVGASNQSRALSGQTLLYLQQQFNIHWVLWAKSGADSRQTLAMLSKKEPQAFDCIVISLGVNDVISFTSKKQWLHTTQRLISLLGKQFAAQQIIFTAIPPLHHFPALPQPLRFILGNRARQFNQALDCLCQQQQQCQLLKVSFGKDRSFFAEDGFHPGEKGYAVWGQQLAGLIKKG